MFAQLGFERREDNQSLRHFIRPVVFFKGWLGKYYKYSIIMNQITVQLKNKPPIKSHVWYRHKPASCFGCEGNIVAVWISDIKEDWKAFPKSFALQPYQNFDHVIKQFGAK